jgi:hypothetical protein
VFNYKSTVCRLTDRAGCHQEVYSRAHRPLSWDHLVQEYTDKILVQMQGRWSPCTPAHINTENRLRHVKWNTGLHCLQNWCRNKLYTKKNNGEMGVTAWSWSIFTYSKTLLIQNSYNQKFRDISILVSTYIPRKDNLYKFTWLFKKRW